MRSIPTEYAGIRFRSRLEATWAAFFDYLGWEWQYEPFDCTGWIPDFALVSHRNSPRPVLVEVKPISSFDVDVAAKIDAADMEHEVVLVGIGPFRSPSTGCVALGWLREFTGCEDDEISSAWGVAPFGLWEGSESRNKNPARIVGFCHEDLSFSDRISGCYDGGSYGAKGVNEAEITREWHKAKNAVQWLAPGSSTDAPVSIAAWTGYKPPRQTIPRQHKPRNRWW